MSFLKESHIKSVSTDAIDHSETTMNNVWTAYPLYDQSRRSNMSLYFDEACKLSFLARDVSLNLSRPAMDRKVKQAMYIQLIQWEKERPREFDVQEGVVPYILVLRWV